MKTIILSTILFSSICFCQELKKGDQLTLKTPVKVDGQPIKMNGVEGDVATYLEDGYIFKVIKKEGGKTQLKALNFEDAKVPPGSLYNSKIYTVLDTDLIDNFKIREQKDRLSIGIITLPFKYRPQSPESFETEFNINTTLNVYWMDAIGGSLHFQVGTGFGSVRLDPLNSSLLAENSTNAISLGFIAGPMFQYKNVQFGIYSGVDIINNNSKHQWAHNGNLWFGLGIGYNLFKIDFGGEKNKQ